MGRENAESAAAQSYAPMRVMRFVVLYDSVCVHNTGCVFAEETVEYRVVVAHPLGEVCENRIDGQLRDQQVIEKIETKVAALTRIVVLYGLIVDNAGFPGGAHHFLGWIYGHRIKVETRARKLD